MVYLFLISTWVPILIFTVQLIFSDKIGFIFGMKTISTVHRFLYGLSCLIIFPFIPAVLFFLVERKKNVIYYHGFHASDGLYKLNNEINADAERIILKQKVIKDYKMIANTVVDINDIKTLRSASFLTQKWKS